MRIDSKIKMRLPLVMIPRVRAATHEPGSWPVSHGPCPIPKLKFRRDVMAKIRNHHTDITPGGTGFSRVVRSGNLVFIAGVTARGSDSQGKSFIDQLRVVLDRITRIVAAEGGSPGDITKFTTFVTNVEDWRGLRRAKPGFDGRVFPGGIPGQHLNWHHSPGRTRSGRRNRGHSRHRLTRWGRPRSHPNGGTRHDRGPQKPTAIPVAVGFYSAARLQDVKGSQDLFT